MDDSPVPQDDETSWDHIVIGAGSAGSAVAGRLAERNGNRVLLIEAGGTDRHPYVSLPFGTMKLMRHPRFDWCYPTAPDPSLDGRATIWSAGKVVGGGSSINGMVFLRGLKSDFDRWIEFGAQGWGWDDVLPYFRKLESWQGEPSPAHGGDGPIRVGPPAYVHPLAHRILAAAHEAGFPVVGDLNAGISEGVGLTPTNIVDGFRQGAGRAYLRRTRREGLKLVTHALAERLLFDGARCTGVLYRTPAGLRRARCQGDVIVSSGAIGSPALLMRSGVGPAALLRQVGIEVLLDRAGVGGNLQEHAGIPIVYSVNVPTVNEEAYGIGAVRTAMRWLFKRTGAAAMSVVNVSGFIRTDPALEFPDVQIQFAPFGYDNSGEHPTITRDPRISFTINPCRPRSRGRIEISSPSAADAPVIRHELLGDRDDLRVLSKGLEAIRRMATTPALSPITRYEVFPGSTVDDDSFEEIAVSSAFPQCHPTSTCAMGRMAVLDPQLRVRGVSNLRIADASAMPTILSTNTNAASIMIGERAADFILKGSA